jgi:hypothetical protein
VLTLLVHLERSGARRSQTAAAEDLKTRLELTAIFAAMICRSFPEAQGLRGDLRRVELDLLGIFFVSI